MKMWIDTEFNEYKGALISMALVAEDGRDWYGVRYCDDAGWWVSEHVMPNLLQLPERDMDLRARLAEFLGQFDGVHIIADWPGDIAHFCNFLEYAPGGRIGPDTITFEVRRDLPDTATTSAIPHNALEDARALAGITDCTHAFCLLRERGDKMNVADQIREMGLEVGDTIVGREFIENDWHEAELTLLWVGKAEAVFSERSRDSNSLFWSKARETADWWLDLRDWVKVPKNEGET